MSISDYIFKILLMGDVTGCKTSFVQRYISGFFMGDFRLTIGVDYYSKTTLFKDKEVKLQIWNFGGEERFQSLLPKFCKGSDGAFFMYDITTKQSIDYLSDWTQTIRENTGDIPIMLIGSKLDLHKFREISHGEGILAAKKYNLAAFLEVSSKTGENVEKAFGIMIKLLVERHSQNTIKISNSQIN
ncbi:MAG: GTP-binding protein [Candidatus Lokiarchaeota archaeon]|nr:GTP-binding protein [Candidatus Lokiarchaeota archaeon]